MMNFTTLELKLEKSLTLMEKIIIELREIKEILREQSPQPVKVNITYSEGE